MTPSTPHRTHVAPHQPPVFRASAPDAAALSAAPTLAIPTLLLAMAGAGLWLTSFVQATRGAWPGAVCVTASAVAAYALYITMHDAAHGGVSRSRWVNELVGRLSCPAITPLLAFPAFRYMHLCHHGATNEPDSDPDMWASGESIGALIWRFATIDVGYYAFYLRRIRDRSRGELLDAGGSLLFHGGIVAGLCGLGLGSEVLLFWILPGRVTVFFLAWLLDYLPHRPHRIRQRDDAYRATCVRVGHEAWISPLMLWQNYHLSHHLYPRAPFWRTVALWRAREQWHLSREPALVTIWGRPLSVEGYRALRGLPSLDESGSGEHVTEAPSETLPMLANERAGLAG